MTLLEDLYYGNIQPCEYEQSAEVRRKLSTMTTATEKLKDIPGEYTLIFGHTPTYHYNRSLPMSICHKRRFICIDCGAGTPESADYRNGFCYGRLACLRLDDMKEFYSEENDEYEKLLW